MEEDYHISILSPCVVSSGFDTFNFRGIDHVSGGDLKCKHGRPSYSQVSLAVPSGITDQSYIIRLHQLTLIISPLTRKNQQFHYVIVTSFELDTRL